MSNSRLSFFSFLVCAALLVSSWMMFAPKGTKIGAHSVFAWDGGSYYWYLPSMFIYKDLRQQKFGDSIAAKYHFTPDFSQSYLIEKGNRVIGYSSGLALIYLPFFAIAHALAEPLGFPADGFSEPYQFSVSVGSLLIALIGVWYFRKLFLLYFEDKVVAVLLLILVVGTNYLNYSAIGGLLTHNALFAIYVFILLNTHHFYREQKTKYAIRIGLLVGLAVLTRPSEIIAILIPLLWGMESLSKNAIKQRLEFLRQQKSKLVITTVCAVAVSSIQVIYWLYVAGKPFVYVYRDQGFSWLPPHTIEYVFSYRSGWLIYTPMVILIFAGIVPFVKWGKNRVAILLFFALNLYIVSAWDIWWYAGSGGRAMVQSYPVIFFPLASLIQWMLQRRARVFVLTPFILLFTYCNIWFTWHSRAAGGLYDAENMTRAYYRAVIGRWRVPDDTEKLKDTNELFLGAPKAKQLLYENDFETDSLYNADIPAVNGTRSLYIKEHTVSPEYVFAYAKENKDWIRVQATFKCIQKQWNSWRMLQFVVRFKNKSEVVKERMMRVDRFLYPGAVKDIFIDVKLPEDSVDSIQVFFWNWENDLPVVVDDLKVWSFDEPQ